MFMLLVSLVIIMSFFSLWEQKGDLFPLFLSCLSLSCDSWVCFLNLKLCFRVQAHSGPRQPETDVEQATKKCPCHQEDSRCQSARAFQTTLHIPHRGMLTHSLTTLSVDHKLWWRGLKQWTELAVCARMGSWWGINVTTLLGLCNDQNLLTRILDYLSFFI